MKANDKGLTYSLTYQDVVEILTLIDESGTCEELHLELGDFKLTVVRDARDSGAVSDVPVEGAGESGGSGEAFVDEGARRIQTATPLAPATRRDLAKPPDGRSGSNTQAASGIAVTSPLAGIFYRAPAPGAPPFVEVGSVVKEDDPVGIIEVMKLMNLIRASQRGAIRGIFVENETPVEYGQLLMLIEPIDT